MASVATLDSPVSQATVVTAVQPEQLVHKVTQALAVILESVAIQVSLVILV